MSIGFTFSDPDQIVSRDAHRAGRPGLLVQRATSDDGQGGQGLLNGLQLYRQQPAGRTLAAGPRRDQPGQRSELSQKFTATVAYNTVKIDGILPEQRRDEADGGRTGTTSRSTSPTTVPAADVLRRRPAQQDRHDPAGRAVRHDATIAAAGTADGSQRRSGWCRPRRHQLTMTATADQPVNADFFYQSGNPDQYSAAAGNGATVQVNAPQVSPGIWETDIGQTGPFSGSGSGRHGDGVRVGRRQPVRPGDHVDHVRHLAGRRRPAVSTRAWQRS